MLAPGAPVLISGLRGVLGTSLDVSGLRRDLHAGAFGGAVTNPAEVLATLVASLHDKAGRVPVAGFYDQVRPMTEKERLHLARAARRIRRCSPRRARRSAVASPASRLSSASPAGPPWY